MDTTIKEIVMHGIKGQNTVQPLTGKDIIIGPNGSGKTTRIQALGIAIQGYCPGQGKQASETAKLSTDGDMTVGLSLDEFTFTRRFSRKEKREKDGSVTPSVTESVFVSPSQGEKNDTQKKARISAEVGNFTVMLDFTEFLQLSDAKRRDFFYSLSPFSIDAWDRSRVEKYIHDRLLTMELEVNDPDQYAIMNELIGSAMKEYPEKYDVQAGIQSMLDWAKLKQSHWNSEKKNAEGAVRKLSDLKNQLNETDRNILANKEQLETYRQDLITVEKQISSDEQKIKAVQDRLTRLEDLKQLIAKEKENLQLVPENDSAFDSQIVSLEGKIQINIFTDDINKLTAERNEITKELSENTEKRNEIVKTMTKVEGEIAAFEATIQSINGMVKDNQGEQIRICVLSPNVSCPKDFSPYLMHVDSKSEIKRNELDGLKSEYADFDSIILKLGENIAAINEEINGFTKKTVEATKHNEDIRRQIQTLEKQKTDLQIQRTKIQNAIDLYQGEYDRLINEKVDPAAPIDALKARSEGLRSQISQLQLEISDQEKSRNTLANLKSSMIDSKEAAYYHDCSKYLADALGPKGLQGELVKEILYPIQESIQHNLAGMGIGYEFYFQMESETGKEIFQFGWINDRGRKVDFDALSTGQQLLLLIAMMVTLLDRANPPLKVLAVDNIENLDRENFARVINGLDQMAPKLDNIILAGVIDAPQAVDGWCVTQLQGPDKGEAD